MNTEITLILGMHRSGTSLCANVIHALGGDLGNNLIEGDDNNPQGYFEDLSIVTLHENFIQERLNWTWTAFESTIPGVLDSGPNTEIFDSRVERLTQLLSLVNPSELDGRIIKDPRAALFVDVWQAVAVRLGIRMRYVLCLRNPHEVISSIETRDTIPWSRAALIWLKHYRHIIDCVGQDFCAIVDYADWFTDPVPVARRLIDALSMPDVQSDESLADLLETRIDLGLRHHRAESSGASHVLLLRFYELMRDLEDGRSYKELVELVRTLKAAEAFYQEWADLAVAREPSR